MMDVDAIKNERPKAKKRIELISDMLLR